MTTPVLYDISRKCLTLFPPLAGLVNLVILDAPFGRFSPTKDSLFLFDGIKSWIVMELFSPLTFTLAFLSSPLSPSRPALSLAHPSTLLAALFLIHYFNRALLSPLRTPSRSKSHIIVPLAGVTINILNGSTMGAYLSSPTARSFLANAYTRPYFYIGISVWAAGFVGNLIHDEILLDIRRRAKVKKESTQGEHYAIPQGLLYEYISYPNYLCEWVEWIGFALAASPIPTLSLLWQLMSESSLSTRSLFSSSFSPVLTPPIIFVIMEVCVMLPRAYRGHGWYLRRFPEYPKNRKAVLPFLF